MTYTQSNHHAAAVAVAPVVFSDPPAAQPIDRALRETATDARTRRIHFRSPVRTDMRT